MAKEMEKPEMQGSEIYINVRRKPTSASACNGSVVNQNADGV